MAVVKEVFQVLQDEGESLGVDLVEDLTGVISKELLGEGVLVRRGVHQVLHDGSEKHLVGILQRVKRVMLAKNGWGDWHEV